MKKYIVFLKLDYARNLELLSFDGMDSVPKTEEGWIDYDELEENWCEVDDHAALNGWPKIFLGIEDGNSMSDAIAKAGLAYGYPVECLEAQEIMSVGFARKVWQKEDIISELNSGKYELPEISEDEEDALADRIIAAGGNWYGLTDCTCEEWNCIDDVIEDVLKTEGMMK